MFGRGRSLYSRILLFVLLAVVVQDPRSGVSAVRMTSMEDLTRFAMAASHQAESLQFPPVHNPMGYAQRKEHHRSTHDDHRDGDDENTDSDKPDNPQALRSKKVASAPAPYQPKPLPHSHSAESSHSGHKGRRGGFGAKTAFGKHGESSEGSEHGEGSRSEAAGKDAARKRRSESSESGEGSRAKGSSKIGPSESSSESSTHESGESSHSKSKSKSKGKAKKKPKVYTPPGKARLIQNKHPIIELTDDDSMLYPLISSQGKPLFEASPVVKVRVKPKVRKLDPMEEMFDVEEVQAQALSQYRKALNDYNAGARKQIEHMAGLPPVVQKSNTHKPTHEPKKKAKTLAEEIDDKAADIEKRFKDATNHKLKTDPQEYFNSPEKVREAKHQQNMGPAPRVKPPPEVADAASSPSSSSSSSRSSEDPKEQPAGIALSDSSESKFAGSSKGSINMP